MSHQDKASKEREELCNLIESFIRIREAIGGNLTSFAQLVRQDLEIIKVDQEKLDKAFDLVNEGYTKEQIIKLLYG